MTDPQTPGTLPCTVCNHHHPRHLSVAVQPNGLSCGLGCIPQGVRELLGLPNLEDAAIGATPTPPTLRAWHDAPATYFNVELSLPKNQSWLNETDFRRALNVIGLAAVLRADQQDAKAPVIVRIRHTDVLFHFYAYTSSAERVNVWMEGFSTAADPQILGMARLSWTNLPQHPANQAAHHNAAEFLATREP